MDQLVKGVPIQCIVKVKPNNGFQKDDIKVNRNRIGLVDQGNRISDEYDASEVFAEANTTAALFSQTFPAYIRAIIEGINVSVFLYGSEGSGKAHTMEGGKGGSDPGIVPLLSDNLFNILDEKRYQNPSYNF